MNRNELERRLNDMLWRHASTQHNHIMELQRLAEPFFLCEFYHDIRSAINKYDEHFQFLLIQAGDLPRKVKEDKS